MKRQGISSDKTHRHKISISGIGSYGLSVSLDCTYIFCITCQCFRSERKIGRFVWGESNRWKIDRHWKNSNKPDTTQHGKKRLNSQGSKGYGMEFLSEQVSIYFFNQVANAFRCQKQTSRTVFMSSLYPLSSLQAWKHFEPYFRFPSKPTEWLSPMIIKFVQINPSLLSKVRAAGYPKA